ncbi:hypothetical protein B0H13DRAFT_2301661 [Mycena leptocephala]|nr:hypothetical protein B0H13DRAFT_2301661 [Mycena leptocephala]
MYSGCPPEGQGTYSEPRALQWHFEPHASPHNGILNSVPHNDILSPVPHNDILNPVPHNGGFSLLVTTFVTAFYADYLVVASNEETAVRYSISKQFIALILLPIMSIIGICVGSSIQIATFVVPLLVIVGWIAGPGHQLTLFFANFEVTCFPFMIFRS